VSDTEATPAARAVAGLRSTLSRRRKWILAAVAVLGTVLAASAFLLPGFLSVFGSGLGWVPGQTAGTYIVLGLLLGVPALWWLRRAVQTEWDPLVVGPPDEPGRTGVNPGMAEQLHAATVARYEGQVDEAAEAIEAELFEGAVRAVRTGRGIGAERAREAVRSGEWTDDPVAAAFLAEGGNYPLPERLYGRLDPGGAYQHRVERTLDVIEVTRREGEI